MKEADSFVRGFGVLVSLPTESGNIASVIYSCLP